MAPAFPWDGKQPRISYRDRLAAFLRLHPGQWFDGKTTIASVAGGYAWRTRISNCRLQLGMQIDNRERKVGEATVSEYAYFPRPAAGADARAEG